jgi:hypothetical protein
MAIAICGREKRLKNDVGTDKKMLANVSRIMILDNAIAARTA